MYITYITLATPHYGYVGLPHDKPIELYSWRTTECEWMVPGTVTD